MDMDMMPKVYQFRVMHGCFTGGVAIAIAPSREQAMAMILENFTQDERFRICRNTMRSVYYKKFPSKWHPVADQQERPKTWAHVASKSYKPDKIANPLEKWEIVWNGFIEDGKMPHKDTDRNILVALTDALPLHSGNSTGTWMPSDHLDTKHQTPVLQGELEKCTVDDGSLRITDVSSFVFYQGGGD